MSDQPSSFLRAEHVKKQVTSNENTITILQDINLTINLGDTLAILGASGSGKTTLLTLLAGLDLPTAGDIYLQQHHLNQLNEDQRAALRLRQIGFIFQSFLLLPTLTALENTMLPLEIAGMSYQQAKEQAIYWLEKVKLQHRLHHYPTKLSGGEQQRVAIARAFVSMPAVIFADEMTGNLDTHTGEFIMDLLFSLNQQQKTTLVIVTHDSEMATRCQRRMLLQEGTLQPC
ncbi:MAG TPA: ATP-binding cassette domain-containing protein [Gammaproteobacteria bacterium]|jgi:putative ABC transport system ATP-binding protein|nr:ATP-binding cassette domain-containing protein [Gammaproteobacteria bacterium]